MQDLLWKAEMAVPSSQPTTLVFTDGTVWQGYKVREDDWLNLEREQNKFRFVRGKSQSVVVDISDLWEIS